MFKTKLDFNNETALQASIQLLAKEVAFDSLLEINDAKYRIVEFEYYYYGEAFKDVQAHNHNLQKEPYKLYDHASGLDITLGDGTNAAAMLLRGVAKLSPHPTNPAEYIVSKYFDGPHIVRTELISQLNLNQPNNIRISTQHSITIPLLSEAISFLINTARINMSHLKAGPEDKYILEPLRYVLLSPRSKRNETGKLVSNGNPIKVKGIESIVKAALSKNIISHDVAETSLGYTIKINE